jgi:hypothetical protein
MRTPEEINALIAGTFNTELGQRCLEHLKDTFVDRPMYKPGMTLDQVAFREGEASTIRKILKEIRNGRD